LVGGPSNIAAGSDNPNVSLDDITELERSTA
jgi:hypothetical protein